MGWGRASQAERYRTQKQPEVFKATHLITCSTQQCSGAMYCVVDSTYCIVFKVVSCWLYWQVQIGTRTTHHSLAFPAAWYEVLVDLWCGLDWTGASPRFCMKTGNKVTKFLK